MRKISLSHRKLFLTQRSSHWLQFLHYFHARYFHLIWLNQLGRFKVQHLNPTQILKVFIAVSLLVSIGSVVLNLMTIIK